MLLRPIPTQCRDRFGQAESDQRGLVIGFGDIAILHGVAGLARHFGRQFAQGVGAVAGQFVKMVVARIMILKSV